jgi:hypothetical protein
LASTRERQLARTREGTRPIKEKPAGQFKVRQYEKGKALGQYKGRQWAAGKDI